MLELGPTQTGLVSTWIENIGKSVGIHLGVNNLLKDSRKVHLLISKNTWLKFRTYRSGEISCAENVHFHFWDQCSIIFFVAKSDSANFNYYIFR